MIFLILSQLQFLATLSMVDSTADDDSFLSGLVTNLRYPYPLQDPSLLSLANSAVCEIRMPRAAPWWGSKHMHACVKYAYTTYCSVLYVPGENTIGVTRHKATAIVTIGPVSNGTSFASTVFIVAAYTLPNVCVIDLLSSSPARAFFVYRSAGNPPFTKGG